jgi:hypothetical protein
MKRNLCLFLLLMAGMWMSQPGVPHVKAAAPEKNAFTPDTIEFGPAPPFLPAGAQLAVLEGNPMA